MKRKYLSLLLVMLLVFSFGSCGTNTSSNQDNQTQTSKAEESLPKESIVKDGLYVQTIHGIIRTFDALAKEYVPEYQDCETYSDGMSFIHFSDSDCETALYFWDDTWNKYSSSDGSILPSHVDVGAYIDDPTTFDSIQDPKGIEDFLRASSLFICMISPKDSYDSAYNTVKDLVNEAKANISQNEDPNYDYDYYGAAEINYTGGTFYVHIHIYKDDHAGLWIDYYPPEGTAESEENDADKSGTTSENTASNAAIVDAMNESFDYISVVADMSMENISDDDHEVYRIIVDGRDLDILFIPDGATFSDGLSNHAVLSGKMSFDDEWQRAYGFSCACLVMAVDNSLDSVEAYDVFDGLLQKAEVGSTVSDTVNGHKVTLYVDEETNILFEVEL